MEKEKKRMILDFSDCKTEEEVNKKWLEYVENIELYKSLFRKLREEKKKEVLTSQKVY